ncbi:MAG: GHMP family kinase ATP-binding protein [Promethearchaeota archaeon]
MKIYRSKAPFRVSFAGGGTDLPDWATKYGGQVICTTINKYVHISVEINQNSADVKINAHDLDKYAVIPLNELEYNGEFDLIKSVLRHFKVSKGCEITIHSDLPAGSGMGTSSSLLVALISVFSLIMKIPMNKHDIAELACNIERKELAQAGGYQDQYAAAFGGFNFIKFTDKTTVYPLKLSEDLLNELNYRLVLCYTGKTHISADIQKILIKNFEKIDTKDGMFKLKELAVKMRDILIRNDVANLDEFGKLQHESWIAKKQTSDNVSNPDIEKLYMHSLQNGAIGGKLLGAGGGGHLILFAKPTERMKLIKELVKIGGEIVDFQFENSGVISWQAK